MRESTVLTAAELEENAKLNQEEYEEMKNMVEDFLKLNFRDLNIDTEIDDLMDTLIDDTLRNQLSPTTQLILIQQMIHTLDSLKSDIAQHTDPVVIKAMKLKAIGEIIENIDLLKLRMNSFKILYDQFLNSRGFERLIYSNALFNMIMIILIVFVMSIMKRKYLFLLISL